MTDENRLLNALGDWLEDQPSQAPDHLLDAFLSDLQRTPQRGRWRTAVRGVPMLASNTVRFSLAAGAVALAALIAVGMWTGQQGLVPGSPPSPSPSASPAPTPTVGAFITPSPLPSAPPTQPPASPTTQPTPTRTPLTWRLGEPFFVQASVDVASSWIIYRASSAMAGVWAASDNAILWITAGVRPIVDPCARLQTLVDMGPTADDIVDALAAIPVDVSAVTETSIAGYPARHLSFTAPPPRDGCEDGSFPLWRWSNGYQHGVGPGHLTQAWVVDVEGTPVLIITEYRGTDQERAELEQMLESIRLAPAEDES
jgi:hypothetical protein